MKNFNINAITILVSVILVVTFFSIYLLGGNKSPATTTVTEKDKLSILRDLAAQAKNVPPESERLQTLKDLQKQPDANVTAEEKLKILQELKK